LLKIANIVNTGSYVFKQFSGLISRYEFDKCVDRYKGNYRVRDFNCWNQFLCMAFGQLTHRESITDILTCLGAHGSTLYHMGIKPVVAVSSLTRANENRDHRIYKDFAMHLLRITRPLYSSDSDFTLELDNSVYAFDSTTIDLCLTMFEWAKFRKTKAAVKMHTLLDLRGNLPTFIHITDGKVHDVNSLDVMPVEQDAFYVMDRGYVDFARLYAIAGRGAFFVVRAKDNLSFTCTGSRKVDKTTGLRCDQTIKLKTKKSAREYPGKLRRVKFFDEETGLTLVFLTNNFEIDAIMVAMLYKQRWQVELFFKWIKQHLKIKAFWGFSENAVKTQIWIAVCTYLLLAYLKKQVKSDLTLYEIQQILSVSIFSKTPINELLNQVKIENKRTDSCNQLNLFDL
jgi:hypothetical protein